jgi:hypothetical protein
VEYRQVASSDSSDDSDDDVILNMNRDGTRSSANAEELRIAAALAKDPWGRSVMSACSVVHSNLKPRPGCCRLA